MGEIRTADVVIVGGGVIGCSIAYHLTARGASDVVLLESESLASGATGICPGGIRQQFEGEADCVLARHSVRFWEDINEILEPEHPFRFEQSGYLFLADTEELLARFRRNVAMQNRLGIPARMVNRDEVGGLLPALNLDGVLGGTFCDEDGFLEDCHGVCAALVHRACGKGARVVYEPATRLKRLARGWEIESSAGKLHSDHVVLAAGVGSVPLASDVGVTLPITAEPRRLAFTEPYASNTLPMMLVALEREVAAKQLAEGVVYLGWLRESPDDSESVFVERSLLAGATLLPFLEDLPVRRVAAGIYDVTPDRRPLLGAAANQHNLWLAAGFSGHGFMIAPAVGDAVAACVTGQASDWPLEAFSLNRFAGVVAKEGLVI